LSISKPNRSLPLEIIQETSIIEKQGIQLFNRRKFRECIKYYKKMLDLFKQKQEAIGRPIHKGTPYHMIGVCYTGLNEHNEALKYILLAYIEDTLNSNFDNETEADGTPAGQMLLNYYFVSPEFLVTIKKYVYQLKKSGKWTSTFNPEEILDIILHKCSVSPEELIFKLPEVSQTSIPETPQSEEFGFPEPWEKRVFIGGSYQTHMAVLRYIEKVVESLGFKPVVAFDVQMPKDLTHHHTLLLLHTCKYAIFEISSPAGQYMEIERTIDYETKSLLLYSIMSSDGYPSKSVSSMIQTMKQIKKQGYLTFKEIDSIVKDFLQN